MSRVEVKNFRGRKRSPKMPTRKEKLLNAVRDRQPVTGYTHGFYRYPARFSPVFAREFIRQFTKPGDLVLDPFAGGGTTLVEARALGRSVIGIDISQLAVFVSNAKTTVLTEADINEIQKWSCNLDDSLNLRNPSRHPDEWSKLGYQRNISSRTTWPLRKTVGLALGQVEQLQNAPQRQFSRCGILGAAQWALDCREQIPTAAELRSYLQQHIREMIDGVRVYKKACCASTQSGLFTSCLHRSVIGLEQESQIASVNSPALVLTSPPYPGVHVLYHRWQVRGRKETPAPFWIAGAWDGHGESYYTFGSRKEPDLSHYFHTALASFQSVARVINKQTKVIQLVAFSNPEWQLLKYLRMMEDAGFKEVRPQFDSPDGRPWRSVPNRKWYARHQGDINPSSEVVLFHKLA